MHGDTPRRVIFVKSIVTDTKIEEIHICIIHFALLVSPSCKKKRVGRDCTVADVSIYSDEDRKLAGLQATG